MSPIDHQDHFTEWLNDNWQPEASEAECFTQGLGRRQAVHRKRRVTTIGVTAMSFVIIIGLGSAWKPTTTDAPSISATTEHVVAQNTDTTTDFWDSAFTDSDDPTSIPDDYEALAGFFLGDT